MRTILLLLGLFAVSLSVSIDNLAVQETAARQFFGSAVTAFQQGDYGKVFDMLIAKFEQFFPGFLNSYDKKQIRDSFVAHFHGNNTMVSDDILVHVIGLCKNFPGVKECDNLMSFV